MKHIAYLTVMVLFITSCGTYRSLDLRKLTTGMTKAQVEKLAGAPNRVISINENENGYQEVLEYRTTGGDIYALEFWNDYLTGYEYLYDDVEYIAPMYPPPVYPPYGRPIYVVPGPNRPNRPNWPNHQPNRPNRPNQSNRPERPGTGGNNSGSGRPPATTRPTTKPAEGSRPVGTRPDRTSTSRDQSQGQTSTGTRTPERRTPSE